MAAPSRMVAPTTTPTTSLVPPQPGSQVVALTPIVMVALTVHLVARLVAVLAIVLGVLEKVGQKSSGSRRRRSSSSSSSTSSSEARAARKKLKARALLLKSDPMYSTFVQDVEAAEVEKNMSKAN